MTKNIFVSLICKTTSYQTIFIPNRKTNISPIVGHVIYPIFSQLDTSLKATKSTHIYIYIYIYIWMYVYTRYGVNSILSIPINFIWSISNQIDQFQVNSKFINTFYHEWVFRIPTLSNYLEYLLQIVYIPSRIVMEIFFLN